MFHFVAKYETMRYESSSTEIMFPLEHWEAGRMLYDDVRQALIINMTAGEFESFFESVKKRSGDLLQAGERFLSDDSLKRPRMT